MTLRRAETGRIDFGAGVDVARNFAKFCWIEHPPVHRVSLRSSRTPIFCRRVGAAHRGWIMRIFVLMCAAAAASIFPLPALAEDIGGIVPLQVTEAPVAHTEGVLSRDGIVVIHELRAGRAIVLAERAGTGMASSDAGDALVGISGNERVFCDLSSRRALAGGFIPCFEDRDGDGRVETRYLGSTRTEFPSTFLIVAAPDSIEPATYREAEPHERPIVRIGFDPCALGRRPTFKLVIATLPDEWSSGGRCQTAEQTLQTFGVGFSTEQVEAGVSYRVTQTIPAGGAVVLIPSF